MTKLMVIFYSFFAVWCSASVAYAVIWCPSVFWVSVACILSKRINIS